MMGVFENFGIIPDIITIGKGITSGYFPLGLCVVRKEIIDSLDKAQHIFTYGGHPIVSSLFTVSI